MQNLLDLAKKTRENAHAPYSHFKVGVALLDTRGDLYAGCNVENVAYPQGLCAEASAIAAMVAGGGRWIDTLLLLADSANPLPPCGGCRQKIAEFSKPDTKIYLYNLKGDHMVIYADALLPTPFSAAHMGA